MITDSLATTLPSGILLVQKMNSVNNDHPNLGEASLEPSIHDFWVGFPAFLNKYGVLHYDIAGFDVLKDPDRLALYGIIFLSASSFYSLSEIEIQPLLHALEKFPGLVICEGPIPDTLFSLSGIRSLHTKESLSSHATEIKLVPLENSLKIKMNSALSDVRIYGMPLMNPDHSVLLGVRQFIQDPIPALESLPKGSIRWFFQRLMYQYHQLYESVLSRGKMDLLNPEFVDIESIDTALILFLSYLRADKSFSPQAETAMAQKMIGWVQEVLPLNETVREASFLPISLERGSRLMLLKLVADTPSQSMNPSLQTYQHAIQEWIGVPELLPGHSLIGYLKAEAYGVWSSLCETFQTAFKALQDGKSCGGFSNLISSLIFSKVRKQERMQLNAMAEKSYQALSHLVVRVWFLKKYDENFSGQSPLFQQLLNVIEAIPWEKQLSTHKSSLFFKQSVSLSQDISFFSLALCLYGQLGDGEKVKKLGTAFFQTYFDWGNFYFTQFPLQKPSHNKLSRLVWMFECIGELRDVEKESSHPDVAHLEKPESLSYQQGDLQGDLKDGEDLGGLFFESQNGNNHKKFNKDLACEPPPGFSTEKDPYAQLGFPFHSVELSPGAVVLINAVDGEGQALGPACVQFGRWLSFPFPVFSILAHGHYVPSLPGSYKGLTTASNNLGTEVMLGTLLLEFIQKHGVPMPLVYPWPEHAQSCFTLRRDVDRPLTHRQFYKLLKADQLRGIHASWYWLTRNHNPSQIHALGKVVWSNHEEAGWHADRWETLEDHPFKIQSVSEEEKTLENNTFLGKKLFGATIHGGPSSMGWCGKSTLDVYQQKGVSYCDIPASFSLFPYELLVRDVHAHTQSNVSQSPFSPSPSATVVSPGIGFSPLLAMPFHFTYEESKEKTYEAEVTQGWAFTQWMRGYFILMNHPDLHEKALGKFLGAFVNKNKEMNPPGRSSACYKTSQEVVDWWKKTHNPENLNYTFASSAQGWSLSVTSMYALKGLTFEIYLPDSPQSLRENPPSQESEALLRSLGMGDPIFKNEMAKPKCFQYNIETFNQGIVLRVVLDVAEQVLYEMVWPKLKH